LHWSLAEVVMKERAKCVGLGLAALLIGIVGAPLLGMGPHAHAQTTTATGIVIVPAPSSTPAPVYAQPAPVYAQPTYGAQTYGAPEPRRSGPNLGLIISGSVLLGVGWLSCLLVGLGAGTDPFSGRSQPEWDTFRGVGFIPIAGPWVQIGVKPNGFTEDLWGGWLVIDGLLQGAGTILLIAGIATSGGDDEASAGGDGVRWVLAPMLSPGQAGLSLAGTF
jgi:hypothetical protein